MTARPLAALLAGLLACGAQAADAPAGTRTYDFVATLDGKPIGHHRFTVVADGAGGRRVTSDADFQVRFLGLSAFHYRHHAEERWQGDCLASLTSSTDDDGKPASVDVRREGEALAIRTADATRTVPGCLMTWAYWNPALRDQKRLLNPQTGKVEAVAVERVGRGTVAVGGQEVAATDWRIAGGESPVDVWISDQGEWIGLDSPVAKGRHALSYRLP